jgi:hypothetical protein
VDIFYPHLVVLKESLSEGTVRFHAVPTH